MKQLLHLFLIISAGILRVHGTGQENDYMIYQGVRCELETHWIFPSPLQVHFIADEARENPFESTSIANYRGHIATWEVSENRLHLISLALSDQNEPEVKEESKREDDTEMLSKKLIRKIFPERVDAEGRVFADWFSGNLRVLSKPVKKQYKEADDEGYELIEFSEITLLQLEKGKVIRETSFPVEEYWSKFNTYLQYRKLDPEEIAALREHVGFIDKHGKGWEEIDSKKPKLPLHTEDDFPVFLSRRLSRDIRIPLTEFVVVKDATIDFSETGYTIGSDLRIKTGAHLLILEMDANGVPLGPWSPHTGGSVQLVIRMGDLRSKDLAFTEADSEIVKMINNFAGSVSTKKQLNGTLHVSVKPRGDVSLSGEILLTSEGPSTIQKFSFNDDKVPVLNVRDYLRMQKYEDDLLRQNAEDVYKEILEKSSPSIEAETKE